jgi:uncharacterized phiE125 gp8 family phage protein
MATLREVQPLATIAAEALPISLTRAKLQVRVDGDAEDALLLDKLVAAIEVAEGTTNRSIARREWELVLDAFPSADVEIPRPPIAADELVRVIYTAVDGTQQEVDTAVFEVEDTEPAILRLAPSSSWPAAKRGTKVRVRFTAGYTAATLPRSLQDGILVEFATAYAYREDTVTGTIVSKGPRAARSLFLRHLVPTVAE